jgi:hypothetical protein
MAEVVKREIDGNEYEIKPFLGMHGLRLQMRLGKILGPSIKEVIGGFPKEKVGNILDASIDPAMIGNGLSAFVTALTDNDPKGDMVVQLLAQTVRNGIPLNEHEINKVYAANYAEMFKAVFAVVIANGFFGISDTGLSTVQNVMAGMASQDRSTKA